MPAALLQSNALAIPLADNSVHVVVTSPPYYGLRDYETATWEGGDPNCDHKPANAKFSNTTGLEGSQDTQLVSKVFKSVCKKCGAVRVDKQLGLEETLDEYLENMVMVFREVWRVLRPNGLLWLNMGDSYAGSGGPGSMYDAIATHAYKREFKKFKNPNKRASNHGLKEKDLMGVPWRLAFALQADGWWLRSDCIWSKPNPMPESVKDRPTKSHEYLFLLTKSQHYHYDYAAILEKAAYDGRKDTRMKGSVKYADGYMPANNFNHTMFVKGHERWPSATEDGDPGRNKRTVWDVATQSYTGSHFATFPPDLIVPCIKAGTSESGCCPICKAPWERIIKIVRPKLRRVKSKAPVGKHGFLGTYRHLDDAPARKMTVGWRPVCDHYDNMYERFPKPRKARKRAQRMATGDWWKRVRQRPGEDVWPTDRCIVFDPFGGTGTTALVASNLHHFGIAADISTDYLDLAETRTHLRALKEWEFGKPGRTELDDLPLFEFMEGGDQQPEEEPQQ